MSEPRGRLTDEIAEVIEQKLPEIIPEEVVWDLTMVMGPQGPAIFMFFWMPGAIIGTTVSTVLVMNSPEAIVIEDVEKLLRTAHEGLQEARSQQLTQAQGEAAQTNGEPVQGLIRPPGT